MYRRGSSRVLRVEEYRSPGGLLQAAFREYYRGEPCLEKPPRIALREFAFQLFGSDSYIRHISFETYDEMIDFIAEKVPRQAYYSIAYYELPEAGSMEEKNWLGSDLLFDIDLDHAVDCRDLLIQASDGSTLIGDDCLLEGYRLARRLASMIRRDLDPESITVYFTGHRGFHLRVACEACKDLGRLARREIAMYFAGEGVDPGALFPRARGRARLRPAMPTPQDPGWRGWIAPVLRAAAPRARSLDELGDWPRAVDEAVRQAAVPIDVMVTQDPTRLTRILGSLNGKGALLAVDATTGFRASHRELSPFGGEVEARFLHPVEGARILGVHISARRGEVQPLPAGVALHLVAKGFAEPVRGEVRVGKGPCRRPV